MIEMQDTDVFVLFAQNEEDGVHPVDVFRDIVNIMKPGLLIRIRQISGHDAFGPVFRFEVQQATGLKEDPGIHDAEQQVVSHHLIPQFERLAVPHERRSDYHGKQQVHKCCYQTRHVIFDQKPSLCVWMNCWIERIVGSSAHHCHEEIRFDEGDLAARYDYSLYIADQRRPSNFPVMPLLLPSFTRFHTFSPSSYTITFSL